MPVSARLFASATTAVGLGLLALALLRSGELPLEWVAILGIAVIITELMQVAADDSHAGEPTHFSFSVGVHLAAVVAFGPWGAVLVAVTGVAFVDRLRGVPLRNIGFNAGAFAIPIFVAGHVYLLAGGVPGSLELPGDLLPLLLLAAVAYAGNLLLVSTVVALASHQRVVALAADTARGQGLSALSEAGFGIALAYFVVYEPWGAIMLAPLVLGVFKAHSRLEQHRRETAHALETFARVVDERDAFTSHHSARVADLVESLARWARLPPRQVARLRWAGRLHDLGKVIIDASVLHKPGVLDEREWAIVRRHPRISARILRRFALAAEEAVAVEHHHERYDGLGYHGATDSPLAAHMLTVADSYDAMTSDRPYRVSLGEDVALAEIEREAGGQFHPLVAKAFVAHARGVSVGAALTREEQRALSNLWSLRNRARVRIRLPRPTPQTLGVAGAVTALALLLGRQFPLAAGALALAAASLGWGEWVTRRRVAIAAAIRRSLDFAGEDDRAEALLAMLARDARLRWAGLIAGGSLDVGSLQREWLGEGPPVDAIMGWLPHGVGGDDLVLADAAELGLAGTIACLPLGDRRSPNSYLVLHFASPPRPALEAALRESADALAHALGRLAQAPPRPRLTAVG